MTTQTKTENTLKQWLDTQASEIRMFNKNHRVNAKQIGDILIAVQAKVTGPDFTQWLKTTGLAAQSVSNYMSYARTFNLNQLLTLETQTPIQIAYGISKVENVKLRNKLVKRYLAGEVLTSNDLPQEEESNIMTFVKVQHNLTKVSNTLTLLLPHASKLITVVGRTTQGKNKLTNISQGIKTIRENLDKLDTMVTDALK